MIRIFVFSCITVVISAQRSTIHKEFIDDGKVLQFGPDISEDTPYEVVPIAHQEHPESPDHKVIQLTSFQQDMRFYLEPTDGFLAGVNTPVFSAKKKLGELNNIQYNRIPNAISGKHKMYHDTVNNGAFVIHYDEYGFPIINGIVDLLNTKEKLIIHPMINDFHHGFSHPLLSKFHQKFKHPLPDLFNHRFPQPLPNSFQHGFPESLPNSFHHRFPNFFGRFKRDANSDDLFMPNRTVQYPDLKYTHHHLVYKVPNTEQKKKQQDDYVDENNDDYSWEKDIDEESSDDEHKHPHSDEEHAHIDMVAFSRSRRLRYQANNKVPDIIYPQVLIIVDSSYFKKFNRNVNKLIEYLLAFWNGIDLRYRVYQKPKIRLNIAGIILAEDSTMTPYITKNNVYIKTFKNNKINVVQALRDKAAFMYPETEYNGTDKTLTMKRLNIKFDFIITMTTLDMCQLPDHCTNKQNEYTCDIYDVQKYCDTLGYAYYTGGCAYDSKYKEMEGVGIIEDTGSFLAIVPATHEIGHLLGASHDPDNEHGCDWDDGYLMSYQLTATENSFIWSNCSVASVKKFLQKEARAQCMFNKPDLAGNKIPRQLPGKLYTRDQICDRAIGTYNCPITWYNTRCDRLYCSPPTPDDRSECYAVPNHLVPEGAPCGDGLHCINGRCESVQNSYVHLFLATTTPDPKSE